MIPRRNRSTDAGRAKFSDRPKILESRFSRRLKFFPTLFFRRHSSDDDSVASNNSEAQNDFLPYHELPDEEEIPEAQQAIPPVPHLRPNRKGWFEDGVVSIDVGLLNRRTRFVWPGNAKPLGDPLPVSTELDYFRLLYPMQISHSTLQHTNTVLVRAGRGELDESELLKYYGIRLNMMLDRKRLDIREYS